MHIIRNEYTMVHCVGRILNFSGIGTSRRTTDPFSGSKDEWRRGVLLDVYRTAPASEKPRLGEVCSRLTYIYEECMGKDGVDCPETAIALDSDEYKEIYALTNNPEFYEWRENSEHWYRIGH